jgi:uncharacterized membrane protein YgcG
MKGPIMASRSTAICALPRLAARTAIAVLIALPFAACERTLVWKSLDVEARLDPTGELHVSERHAMVFDGAWNGGERTFRIEPGQLLNFDAISRIDPRTGAAVPLRGSNDPNPGVDQFAFSNGGTLRWRARRAFDLPFRHRELTYVLQYRLFNVVSREGDGYLLHHDFAFADRPGAFEHYSLNFDVDPAWRPAPGFEPRIERTNLPPGQSVILRIPLTWTGAGRPQHVNEAAPAVNTSAPIPISSLPELYEPRASPLSKLGILVAFLGAAGALWRFFDRREAASGRYAPWPEVDARWLEENLFVHRPEVVGAAWDRATGNAEAAALIAAMAAEGKVQNVAGAPPRLKLLVPRESLSEYERAFVERLFIRGDEIDPDTLRSHYASTGFHPIAAVAPRIGEAANALVGKAGWAPLAVGCPGMLFLLFASTLAAQTRSGRPLFAVMAFGAVLFGISMALAASYQWQVRGRREAALIPAPMIVFAALGTYFAPSTWVTVIVLTLAFALLAVALRTARWTGGAGELQNMWNFRAARAFFRRRLARPNEDLDERWIPYLLAFGLGTELDQWSVAAPARAPTSRIVRGSGERRSATGPSDASPAPSYTPGGGMFGGAGASGSWASSIDSFAQGVTAPRSSSGSGSSSSSSHSSSSSSGSSGSGGGSGGGW